MSIRSEAEPTHVEGVKDLVSEDELVLLVQEIQSGPAGNAGDSRIGKGLDELTQRHPNVSC